MNIFLDTEFNGMGGQLLSIGMIADDGKQFYRIRKIYERIDPWVADNVIPVLGDEYMSFRDIQYDLTSYLFEYDCVHIIADWPDDIRYFCELLITGPGMRIATPPLTMEIRRDIDSRLSCIPHNALADAIAIRSDYYDLKK